MAFTAQEEALVRQLLDQQAAILSLAGNESTITSKLGATKVTLSDLGSASSIANTDLLLTRQGTTDKNVRADTLATYMTSELGGVFAPINNPTFTGSPKAPTATQFDNSTILASTEFVQRSLGSFSSERIVTGTETLTASDVGRLIVGTSASISTQTLPLSSDVPLGGTIALFNSGAGIITITRQGSDVFDNTNGATSFTLRQHETAILSSTNAGTWRVIGGSAALRSSKGDFGYLSANNGWQRLPSGITIQWGITGVIQAASSSATSFPFAFPTTCAQVVASYTQATLTDGSVGNPFIIRVATSTAFAIYNGGSGDSQYRYLAIGY